MKKRLTLFELIDLAQTTGAIHKIERVHEVAPEILYSVGGQLCENYETALRAALYIQILKGELTTLIA